MAEAPGISVLCPTRGRPENVRRLAATALGTAAGVIELVLYADDDAPGSVPQDVAVMPWVKVVTGPRIVLSDTWNKCWERASADVFMMCGDDVAFRTPGWDQVVLAEFGRWADRIVFVHGEDGIQGPGFGSHGFIHRKWADTVGYFSPPWFSCDFCDTWLNHVAITLGRSVRVPILTEHMHPNAGKGDWDRTHQERAARGASDNVQALYDSMADRRAADAGKLRAVMA